MEKNSNLFNNTNSSNSVHNYNNKNQINFSDTLNKDLANLTTPTKNSNYIEFHSKTNNTLTVKKSYNINQITNESDNSLLKVKINPNLPNEFALINSNFCVNYLVLDNDGAFNLGTFKEHTERINDVAFFKNNSSPFDKAFVSGSSDGSIKLWDSRTPTSVKTIKTNGIKVFCLETSNDKLIAGFGREIGIWDLKMMKNICRYKSAHSEDVVCMKTQGDNLLTGGEDGIINHFDIKNGLNVDSVISTLNLGQPLSFVDFLDTEINLIQACTSVYSFDVCSFNKGISQYSFDSKSDFYNTDYCLESFVVNSENSKENLYNNNYIQLFSGNN